VCRAHSTPEENVEVEAEKGFSSSFIDGTNSIKRIDKNIRNFDWMNQKTLEMMMHFYNILSKLSR
jgi:hypothetical protein